MKADSHITRPFSKSKRWKRRKAGAFEDVMSVSKVWSALKGTNYQIKPKHLECLECVKSALDGDKVIINRLYGNKISDQIKWYQIAISNPVEITGIL